MYVKIIDKNNVECAPYNKTLDNGCFVAGYGEVSNNDMLIKDGYKPLIVVGKQADFICPKIYYQETDNNIEEYYVETFVKPTFENIKDDKIQILKKMRDVKEQGGFKFLGKVFDSDSISVQRLTVAKESLDGTEIKIFWTCQDNSKIELDYMGFKGALQALAFYSNSLHEKYNNLKAIVNDINPNDEDCIGQLNKIVWED